MDPEDRSRPVPPPGLILVWLGAGGGYLTGLVLELGLVIIPGLPDLSLTLVPFLASSWSVAGCCEAEAGEGGVMDRRCLHFIGTGFILCVG